MKYLKLFEGYDGWYTEKECINLLKSNIDWNMIEDVKDMSLEYIDLGMTLNMNIRYSDYNNYVNVVYFLVFDHNVNKSDWLNLKIKKNTFNKDNIMYGFYLFNKHELAALPMCAIVTYDATNSLVSRIKEAYPNARIY